MVTFFQKVYELPIQEGLYKKVPLAHSALMAMWHLSVRTNCSVMEWDLTFYISYNCL